PRSPHSFPTRRSSDLVARLDPGTGMFQSLQVPGSTFLRGIALDQKNMAWASDTSNGMYKIDASGANMTVMGSISVTGGGIGAARSEEHTSELQSQSNL